MPRYILIDVNTGYIWGDTANVNGKVAEVADPIDACRVIDEANGTYRRRYEGVGFARLASGTATGYHVYRVDARGRDADAFPIITDGQDKHAIKAVARQCVYITSVLCRPAEGE